MALSNLAGTLNKIMAVSNKPSAKTASFLLSPIVTFFSVPVLLGLGFLLVVDFFTGLYKANLLQKVSSTRFGDVFNRSLYYLAVFIVLHMLALVLPNPYQYGVILFEGFVFSGYLLKEAISVLENLKAIQLFKGINDPILDTLIHKIGLDLDHVMFDFKSSPLVELPPPVITQPVVITAPQVVVSAPQVVVTPPVTVTKEEHAPSSGGQGG